MDGNAEAFAAEHEPDDAEFPILETVDVRVWVVVKIGEWAGGDDLFSVGCGGGKAERDVGDLFGDSVDGAIDPNDLLVRIGEDGAGGRGFGAEPGEGLGGQGSGSDEGRLSRVERC